MSDPRSHWVREELARIRAQLTVAETVLTQIRAQDDPRLADLEAKTRQQIATLRIQAEAIAEKLEIDQPRVLH